MSWVWLLGRTSWAQRSVQQALTLSSQPTELGLQRTDTAWPAQKPLAKGCWASVARARLCAAREGSL